VTVPTHRRQLVVPAAAGGVVDAVVHRPDRPTRPSVLLVPGAGGSLDTEPLVALAEVVAACGHLVVRANLVHHQEGRRAPRAETSVAGFREILAAARVVVAAAPDEPWVLGGRSYGGRVATLAVAGGTPAAGLLLSGYPLHPPGKPDRLRVDHWPSIGVPCLFLQGDHDPMADLELLDTNRHKLPRRSQVAVVTGGDHALRVTGARSPDGIPRSPTAALVEVQPAVCAWLAER
jgi:uncharacterized protein